MKPAGQPGRDRGEPSEFLWGAATAAYQTEGASDAGQRGAVAWDAFLERGLGFRGDIGTTAADHLRHLEQDLDLLAELGVSGYRFSISWARVMPDARTPSRHGLVIYERLVDGLLARGITPLATLYHMDLPAALEAGAGWASRDTAAVFAHYAGYVAARLGDRIELWATVNEPLFESLLSHHDGVWPPGERRADRAFAALHHKLYGHGLALQAVQAASPRPACVGLVSSYSPCVPASASAADAEAARRVDAHLNRIVLDPVLLGAYPVEVIEHYERHGAFVAVRDGDLATISQPMGFLGTNYYSRRHVTHPGSAAVNGNGGHEHGYSLQLLADLAAAEVVPPGVLVSEIGLPIEAEGLRQTLCEITDRYGPLPIYVTENGLALHDYVNPEGIINDQARIEFMHEHVEAVAQAIEAGCDVRGYFAWSLLDNLEWHLGYAPRFGLVYVDFATQRRYPKRSYAWYQDFIERQGSRARPRTVAS